jgi:hypothetical protein
MNHPPNSQMRQESSKRRWARAIVDRLVELVIVFVGVYAAFMLNAHQGHEQQRQRRDQILSYLEKEVTASAANLKQVTANYDRRMNEFTSQLAKGEMPDITPISWASSYNANDTTWLLQAGGLELLEIETVARMKEVDSAARTGLSTMAHYQQLSDQLIVPHLAEGRNFFYDPATKQLRKEYAQYPEILKEGSRILHELSEKTDALLAQLRLEEEQHR